MTASADFPLKNAHDFILDGIQDGFLARFDTRESGISSLLFSTFLGGEGADQARDLAVRNDDGSLFVVGQTRSADLLLSAEVQDAFYWRYSGGWDAFLLQLSADGGTAAFGTYLGGIGHDCEVPGDFRECRVALDAQGKVLWRG